MPKDLEIFDSAQGGQALARFSGGDSPLTVVEFPASSSGRAKVETGTGSGAFRITGWVDVSKIPVYTARQVAVRTGHVWIGKHQKVSVQGLAGPNLKVKKSVHEPISQGFSANAACSAFTLEERTPPGWSPAGSARGYVQKRDQIELYDGASGALVTIIQRASSGNGVLYWSTERSGGWIHIEYHGEVVIDAWAKASDLQALPPGETMDQMKPSTTRRSPPRLALAEQPTVVKTTKDIALQNAAGDSGKVIGKIEAGTETYVMDTVAGWASVLPKSLHVQPVSDGQFWVKASDLGL
jgi:hypothetical protein